LCCELEASNIATAAATWKCEGHNRERRRGGRNGRILMKSARIFLMKNGVCVGVCDGRGGDGEKKGWGCGWFLRRRRRRR
jgi:hypothetical protein